SHRATVPPCHAFCGRAPTGPVRRRAVPRGPPAVGRIANPSYPWPARRTGPSLGTDVISSAFLNRELSSDETRENAVMQQEHFSPKRGQDSSIKSPVPFSERLANLSAEKRSLLQQMLLKKRAAGEVGRISNPSYAQGVQPRTCTAPCPLSYGQEL